MTLLASAQAQTPIVPGVNGGVAVTVAVLAMLVVTLLASYLPVRRAMKVDPVVALREE